MNRITKIIGIVAIAVLLAMILILALVQSNRNETVYTSKAEEAVIENNSQILLETIERPNYYDERSGFVFHYPEDFTVYEKDDYLILYDSAHPTGCIVLYMYSDYTYSDGVEIYNALIGHKERTEYTIENKSHKCILYDTDGKLSEEVIEGNVCRKESVNLYLKGFEQSCPAAFYHTVIDGSGVCVGFITSPESEDKDYFESETKMVLSSMSPVLYTGDDPDANDLSISEVKVFDHSIAAPVNWKQYASAKGNSVIYKSVPAKGDRFYNAGFLISKIKIEDAIYNVTDDYFDPYSLLRYQIGDEIGDTASQNPLSENGYEIKSLNISSFENINLNGYQCVKIIGTATLSIGSSTVITTMPDKNISICAYFVSQNDETYSFVFLGDVESNSSQIAILGERLVSGFR